MADFTLDAQTRTVKGKKVRSLRTKGFVPGTLYGPKTEPLSLQFEYRELELALLNAGGTNIIDVIVNGETHPSLARDVQRHILKGDIMHVDFFALDMNTRIRADIPLVYVNESPVVASRQGILITGPNSITVEMLPSKLMNQIEVDLSVLTEMGDTIYVADLPLDPEIMVINEQQEMIAKIVQPSAQRAEEALEALDEGEVGELVEGEEAEETEEEMTEE